MVVVVVICGPVWSWSFVVVVVILWWSWSFVVVVLCGRGRGPLRTWSWPFVVSLFAQWRGWARVGPSEIEDTHGIAMSFGALADPLAEHVGNVSVVVAMGLVSVVTHVMSEMVGCVEKCVCE